MSYSTVESDRATRIRYRPASNARRYGLTLDEYYALRDRGCGWCGEPLGEGFHIDHDHETGAVRSATHPACNRNWIGGHTLETARKLVEYLSVTSESRLGRSGTS